MFVEVHRFREIDSTNLKARELAQRGAPEGTLVVAQSQSAGHGRKGRLWHSGSGGLWMSLVLRPPTIEGLTLMASLAMVRTVAELGVTARIRWPNDVMVGGRKLAGLLAESLLLGDRVEFVVLGVGLNVNNPIEEEIRAIAINLHELTGSPQDVERLRLAYLEHFEELYTRHRAQGARAYIGDVREVCELSGRRVRIETADGVAEGLIRGITDAGSLELEDGAIYHAVERVVPL